MSTVQIYVCHHPLLVDRKDYLSKQLAKYNLSAKWIEEYSPNNITVPRSKYNLSLTEYSLYLKHEHALQDIIKNNHEYGLILEDDVLLGEDFNDYFDKILNEFVALSGEIVMIGTARFPGLNLAPYQIIPGKYVYHDPSYTTRCTHAIMYNIVAAKIVVLEMQQNPWAYDHKLNEIIINKKIKTCWAEPGLFQGSRADAPSTHFWCTSLR